MTTLQVYEILAVIYKNFGNPLSVDDIMRLMKGVSKRQLSCVLEMLSDAKYIEGVLLCETLSSGDTEVIGENIEITLKGIEFIEVKLPKKTRKKLGIIGCLD